jgi:hypothetical protein
MSLTGIVKRHKRTLMRFLDSMMIPSLRKIMWRNMQYQNGRYVPVNFVFNASNTMGIMQREYETSALTQLLPAMVPGSRAQLLILKGIVSNTGLQNRHEIIKALDESAEVAPVGPEQAPPPPQEDPQLLQLKLQELAGKIQLDQAKTAEVFSNAQLNQVKAREMQQTAELEALKIATKGMYAVDPEQQKEEFDRRYKMAQLALQQQDMESNERIAKEQMGSSNAAKMAELALRARELDSQESVAAAQTPRKRTLTKNPDGTVSVAVEGGPTHRVTKNPDGSVSMETGAPPSL